MAYGRVEMPPSYHEDAPRHGLCNCCCCLALSLLLLVVIAIGIALFFFLVLKPTKPEFNLQSASIQNFQVSRDESGTATDFGVYLSMSISLVFSASNPNKVAIDYSPTEFNCLYKSTVLGVAKVPSFHQPAHSHSTVTALVVVDRLNVFQSTSTALLNDATVNDRVTFIINGPVEARVKVLGINSPKVKVWVSCQLVIQPQERNIASRNCNIGQVTLSN